MAFSVPHFPAHFGPRYAQLCRALGQPPAAPVVLALSGGADSVLLACLLAAAPEAPAVHAVHVDHSLRGDESSADARFSEELSRALGFTFVLRRAPLDPGCSNLEARARELRYAALLAETERVEASAVLTGHHADDALETLLLRWTRGTALGGLAGLRGVSLVRGGGAPIRVLRPLLHMRREEVRCWLRDAGIPWREDSSNQDLRFARNRAREALLPRLAGLAGVEGLSALSAFARTAEALEDELARATAELWWRPFATAAATRARWNGDLGGTLERAQLMRLPRALRRRALWRLISEASGRSPRAAPLEAVLVDLERGRTGRRMLGGAWQLQLRGERIDLLPPLCALRRAPAAVLTSLLPFPAPHPRAPFDPFTLAVPGLIDLPDGRRLSAEAVARTPGAPVPRSATEVELDARDLPGTLTVRFARPGDRFHPLGAPGSRPLARFLSDARVPREERGLIPLVFGERELLWVGGLRPCQPRRVTPQTQRRLRLSLLGAGEPRETVHIRQRQESPDLPHLFQAEAPSAR